MVINDQNQITEAIAYQPYGTIVPMEDIATSTQTSTRQQFTGKEFDREGSGVGISGMELYYFGKRYYYPEVGVWISTDPKGQFFNPYGYSVNPIIYVDPNGETFFTVGFLISTAVSVAGNAVTGAIQAGAAGKDPVQGALIGAGIGLVSSFAGRAAGFGINSNILSSMASGAASGFTSGFLNSWAYGGEGKGFFNGDIGKSALIGTYSGAIGGAIGLASGIATEAMYDKVAYSAPSGSNSDRSILGHEYNLKVSENVTPSGYKMGANISRNVTWGQVFTEGITGGIVNSIPGLFTPTINAMHALQVEPAKGNIPIKGKIGGVNVSATYKGATVFDQDWFSFLYY